MVEAGVPGNLDRLRAAGAGDAEQPVVEARPDRRRRLEAIPNLRDGGRRAADGQDGRDADSYRGRREPDRSAAPDTRCRRHGAGDSVRRPAEDPRHDDQHDEDPGEAMPFPRNVCGRHVVGRQGVLARGDRDADGRRRSEREQRPEHGDPAGVERDPRSEPEEERNPGAA